MPPTPHQTLPIHQRRRSRRLAVWNAALWAVGNGLASTTLVMYLAKELHSERLGLGIGLLVATPQVAGLLRLAAPAMIEQMGDRKRFCITTFLGSALLLMAMPWVSAPGVLSSAGWSLAALVALWCLYHLLQYLGTVALWSWLADVAPQRIRGRFLGRRERWLVAGQAAAAVAAGLFVYHVLETCPALPSWIPYAVMSVLGAMFMLVALMPLALMPQPERGHLACTMRPARPRSGVFAPFRDVRFLPLLAFGCWFSFFNGCTQPVTS